MCVQILPEAGARIRSDCTGWNPFDLTKAWPHKDCPLIGIGIAEHQIAHFAKADADYSKRVALKLKQARFPFFVR